VGTHIPLPYTVPCTPYPIPRTPYHVPRTLYAVPCITYPLPYTPHPVPCTPHPVQRTTYPVSLTTYSVPCTPYHVPYTPYAVPVSRTTNPLETVWTVVQPWRTHNISVPTGIWTTIPRSSSSSPSRYFENKWFVICRYLMKLKLRSLSKMLVEYLSVQVSDIMKTRKGLHGEWQFIQPILHAQAEVYCTGFCYTQCNNVNTCIPTLTMRCCYSFVLKITKPIFPLILTGTVRSKTQHSAAIWQGKFRNFAGIF